MTVERFVEKWGEKGYKGGSLDRLFYFYSCFGPGGENEVLLLLFFFSNNFFINSLFFSLVPINFSF